MCAVAEIIMEFFFRLLVGIGSIFEWLQVWGLIGQSSYQRMIRDSLSFHREGRIRKVFWIRVIFPNPNQSINSKIDKEKHRSNLEIGSLSLFSAPVEYIDDSSIAAFL